MKVAIVGYGKQGRSAYEYWKSAGNEITVCDRNDTLDLPADAHRQTGEFYLHQLDRFDLIVRSPSIHPRDLVASNSLDILNKVTTVTDEFFRVCPSKNVVGVTGTKGKGTTSTLIAKILEAMGKNVHLGGNIGIPPLDLLHEEIKPEDYIVLELANFQLIDIKHSPHIAVCLMVVPEHLDWHSDAEEYYTAKSQLFRHQSEDDIAVYYDKNEISKRIAGTSKGLKIPYMLFPGGNVVDGKIMIDDQTICGVDELKLLGEHNWQNVCAAVTAVWNVDKNIDAIRSVLTTFTGLHHRLEFVRELDGIRYYDDSFGTTPETTIVAMEALYNPKILILGGSDKGANYDELAEAIKSSNVRSVVLIGEQGDSIRSALDRVGYSKTIQGGETMSEIVSTARFVAEPGDAVLLSPACASFDMFKNYEDRGDQFKAAAQSLS